MSSVPAVGESEAPAPVTSTSPTGGGGGGGGEGEGAALIRNMDDLKEQAPKVYKAMIDAIAWNIIDSMKKSQKRIKEIRKQEERAIGG